VGRDKERSALLLRRDLMAKDINALIKKHGEKFVFLRRLRQAEQPLAPPYRLR
jgi:translation initiation factor 2 beta subunit (eIF-2beta)/eIF-5